MWGNRLGWMISGVIVLLFGGTFFWLTRGADAVSPTTDFNRRHVDASLALTVSPTKLVRADDDCDAAALYRAAISDPDSPEALEKLHQAASCRRMDLFLSRPQEIIRYTPVQSLQQLATLGQKLIRLSIEHQKAGRTDESLRCARSAFALGAKLYQERITYDEMQLGMSLMRQSVLQMQRLPASERAGASAMVLDEFLKAQADLRDSQIVPMISVLHSIDREVVRQHAGDILHLAEHARERVWRVEAILSVGRMRFFIGETDRPGNQRAAGRLLEKLASDPDPIIRCAVETARAMTLEQYRALN